MEKEFLGLLSLVKRDGINLFIEALKQSDFFTAPASTRFHGSYEGGLVEHSLNVYKLFFDKVKSFQLDLPEESIILCSLLHDVCKIGLYKKAGNSYIYDKDVIKLGHAKRSLARISRYIELTPREENIIRYHMGFFATEVLPYAQEYHSKEYMDAQNKDPAVMLFHHADNEENHFMGKKEGMKHDK